MLCPACFALLGCPVCFALYAGTPALEAAAPEDDAAGTDQTEGSETNTVPPRLPESDEAVRE